MFNFHKPKVYRSTSGCCICKAKSSSSRFTDSKKYEEDFVKCFQLEEHRSGEICNACVLLVKRWKKLPAGSSRNWRHVVDARAGPGIKSLTKFKAKNKIKLKEKPAEKFSQILNKRYLKDEDDREPSPSTGDETEDYDNLGKDFRSCSPEESSAIGKRGSRSKAKAKAFKNYSFIDLSYFTRKVVCCGTIFLGMNGEVIINANWYKPCLGCLSRRQHPKLDSNAAASPLHSTSSASASPSHSSASSSPAYNVDPTDPTCNVVVVNKNATAKGSSPSDYSSDSGYDETHGLEDAAKLSQIQALKITNLSAIQPGAQSQKTLPGKINYEKEPPTIALPLHFNKV